MVIGASLSLASLRVVPRAEIADVLGVSVSAAHKRFRRFRWARVDADTGVVWREPPPSN